MYQCCLKRFLDFVGALSCLVFLSPFMFIVAIMIKLDSRGPVFYKQWRVGKDEKLFLLYKFRSMTNIKRDTHHQVYVSDPEITKVGRWIRRLKVDELPQLINVLLGNMAVIGPRPCIPEMKNSFGEYSAKRYLVKPGLSSLAAIKGSVYLSWEEKGYWDAYYIEHLAFMLDVKIVCKTFVVVIVGEEKLFHIN